MSTKNIRPVKVPIMLDKQRNLQYDLNAFAELEDRFGTIDAAFEALGDQSVKNVRYITYIGLLHEDEELTERQVGSMIGLHGIKEVSELMTKALTEALPEAKADEKN